MKFGFLCSLALLFSLYSTQVIAWSDSDDDGVPDLKDACPHTVANVDVWADGCAKSRVKAMTNIGEALCFERVNGRSYPEACSPITPLRIHFGLGEVDMGFEQVPQLNRLVKFLKGSSANICIVGHSDRSGSVQANKAISLARAENIKQILIQDYGFDATRFSVRGMGSLVAQKSMAKNSADRRVEFLVE